MNFKNNIFGKLIAFASEKLRRIQNHVSFSQQPDLNDAEGKKQIYRRGELMPKPDPIVWSNIWSNIG